MNGARTGTVWIALFAAGLVVAGTAAAASGTVDGTLLASEHVALDGPTDVSASQGIVAVLTSSVDEARVAADRADVRIGWDEGTLLRDPEGNALGVQSADRGVDWHNFTAANVSLSLDEAPFQAVAIADDARTNLHGEGAQSVEVATVENRSLAAHGLNDTSPGSNRDVGFHYTLEEPHVASSGGDRAKVVGNFTLFVNNATIEVEAPGQETWSNWTGSRQSNPDSPAGPVGNPTVKAYEFRVTTLNLTNATLWINATDAVDLYTREATASVDGSVRAPSVSGELLEASRLYEYDEDPLWMWGEGELGLGLASRPASDGRAQVPGSATVPPLALAPSGVFDVQPSQGVEVASVDGDAGPFPLGTWTWLAAGLVGIVALAAAQVPTRLQARWSRLVGTWRLERYEAWMAQGHEHFGKHDYRRAAKWFRRAAEAFPGRQMAWFQLVLSHVEAGRHEEALEVLEEAREARGSLHADLLDLWATAAHAAGRHEEAVEAVLKLGRANPEMASALLDDPAMTDVREDERVRALLEEIEGDSTDDDRSLPGYA